MVPTAAQSKATWTQDRAPVRTDPSGVPGAETEGRAASLPPAFIPLRDQHQREKPSRHEAATSSTGCASQLANANLPKVQFPLNQDTPVISTLFPDMLKINLLPEWTALSRAVYAHEVRIATFGFQKLVESGTSRLRNIIRMRFGEPNCHTFSRKRRLGDASA